MSCSQVATEFSRERYALRFSKPSAFGRWRYTCLSAGRSYSVYRVFWAVLFLLLLILDLLWIVAWGAVSPDNRLTACLDATVVSILLLTLAYCLLAHTASHWYQHSWDESVELTMPYRFAWLVYTCGVNAVFSTMIVFWIFYVGDSPIEQIVKNSLPGCLILLDLSLSGIPLYFCHALYPILLSLFYLGVSTLGLYLSYTLGSTDPMVPAPGQPTVWIGGHALLPNGYTDFTNVQRAMLVLFGAFGLPLVVHTVLLSMVILRDFLSSVTNHSTDAEIPAISDADLMNIGDITRRSSSSSLNADNPRVVLSKSTAPSNKPSGDSDVH